MKKFLFFLSCLFVITSISACAEEPEKKLTARNYMNAFLAAGIPVVDIVVYDEDSLRLLKGCTSKILFADLRFDENSAIGPVGGTVEVYKTKDDLASRKNLMVLFDENFSYLADLLSTERYVYTSPNGLALTSDLCAKRTDA